MVIIGAHFKKDDNAFTTFPADELCSLSGMSSELAVRSLTAQLMTALFQIAALKQQQVFVRVVHASLPFCTVTQHMLFNTFFDG